MKIKSKILMASLAGLTIAVAISSCQKAGISNNSIPAGKQLVQVYMNDDPLPNLFKVIVDIRYIEVKVDTGILHHNDDYYENDDDNENDHKSNDKYGKWDTLSVTPREYDLLKLKNGVDTLIANGFANIGKVTKIRITLGTNNVVWTDSTHHFPLTLCDHDPYVYARVTSNTIDTLINNQLRLRIDFNVAESVEFENGAYCFEPVISCYTDNNSGKIEGKVTPRAAHAIVIAYNTTDTAYAIPEEDGEFKMRGVKPATYSVLYKTSWPYKDTLINAIAVSAGQTHNMPSITLHY